MKLHQSTASGTSRGGRITSVSSERHCLFCKPNSGHSSYMLETQRNCRTPVGRPLRSWVLRGNTLQLKIYFFFRISDVVLLCFKVSKVINAFTFLYATVNCLKLLECRQLNVKINTAINPIRDEHGTQDKRGERTLYCQFPIGSKLWSSLLYTWDTRAIWWTLQRRNYMRTHTIQEYTSTQKFANLLESSIFLPEYDLKHEIWPITYSPHKS